MWKDGSDNELASDMITLMVKGTDSDSQCKDATLAWESTTRDLTMYHNTDGNNEQSAEGGLHFWAEQAVKVNVLSESNCTAYFQLEVYNAVTGTWQSHQDFVEDLRAAVTAADPDDWFSTGIWFDSNNAYVSGWFSRTNMDALIGTYFTEPELKLKATAYAPGSNVAGASAGDDNLVIKEFRVKLYRGAEVTQCEENQLN